MLALGNTEYIKKQQQKLEFRFHRECTLRKHTYSNILKISPPKTEKNSDRKTLIFFHISAQNIDYGCSLEPPRDAVLTSTTIYFLSKNNKNNV